MTTTSYDDVTTATQTGSDPNSWVNISTLAASTSGAAYIESSGTYTGMRTLVLEIPDFMAGLPAGSEFVSMSVQFKGYVDALHSGDYFRFVTRQSASTVRSDDIDSTSTGTRTYSGDAGYWGFTGSAKDILTQLSNGTIKWRFESRGVPSVATRRDVKNFQVQLTYAEPATEAALLQIIP